MLHSQGSGSESGVCRRDQDSEAKPSGLARTEAIAVLVSLLFLICPFLFLLPLYIPKATGYIQSYPTMGILLLHSPYSVLQTPSPYLPAISQKRPLALVMPRERAATHTGQLHSMPVVGGLVRCLHLFLTTKCKSRPPASPTFFLCLHLSGVQHFC